MMPGPVTVRFTREDEVRTVRFRVSPGEAPIGEYSIRAVVRTLDATYNSDLQVVEYPHVARRHLVRAAEATFKIVDVNVLPDLTVGYINGVGDEVPVGHRSTWGAVGVHRR